LASIYLGTGWMVSLFEFPGIVESTKPADFPERFGGPVHRAVVFFSVWTVLMTVGGIILAVHEWDHGNYKWAPVVYTAAAVISAAFTMIVIFPVNKRLSAVIVDETEFRRYLRKWVLYTHIRTGLWTVEWIAMGVWLTALAGRGLK
ncbi:MAG: hypothetical protein JWL70_2825, partial [Acidimicrobiia bacterium]|nr:hypothetical protein [Acidimicrobiia bacterium]